MCSNDNGIDVDQEAYTEWLGSAFTSTARRLTFCSTSYMDKCACFKLQQVKVKVMATDSPCMAHVQIFHLGSLYPLLCIECCSITSIESSLLAGLLGHLGALWST